MKELTNHYRKTAFVHRFFKICRADECDVTALNKDDYSNLDLYEVSLLK
jgi:hypothetical protein